MTKGLRILLLLMVLFAAGCRSSVPEEAARLRTVIRRPPSGWAALDSLSIAVPLSQTPWVGGECEEIPPPLTSGAVKLLSMVWPEGGTQDRRVTIGFDGMGNPVGYTDAREGLATIVANPDPATPIPPGTLIVISLERKRATVENQFEDGSTERVLVDFEEALKSERLGNPRRIIQEVLDRCAGTPGGKKQ